MLDSIVREINLVTKTNLIPNYQLDRGKNWLDLYHVPLDTPTFDWTIHN